MDLRKDLEALKQASLSSLFEEADLERVFNAGKQICLKKGQILFSENSYQETMYIILSGKVEIYKRHKQIAVRGAGDFFGEMALLDGESRSANVIALEDTEVLTLNRDDFLTVLNDYPHIAILLLKEMAHRLRKSDRQIASLSLSAAEKRIALCILRIAEEQGVIQKGHVSIPKAPIQQDIANMSGTSRETVSRALKLLEKEGFIQRNGRELLINNYNKFIEEFDS